MEKKGIRKISKWSFLLAGLFLVHPVQAISPIPPSTEPERASISIRSEQRSQPTKVAPAFKPPSDKQADLGKQAEKIKFTLNKIELEGNRVYSECELIHLYQKKLKTTISILELQQIVQSISDFYRNNGYILVRAILPPQRVKNGVIKVRILEGFIDKVKIVGNPKGTERMLWVYGEMIKRWKPLQLKALERYMLLANQIPGAQVRAILEPSKATTAASDLNLAVEARFINGYLSYDNYGTRYLGPQQITANAQFNSIFSSGDTTIFTYVTTPRPQSLKYIDVYHETLLGCDGMKHIMEYNESITQPLFQLRPFKIYGQSKTYYTAFRYPAILSREKTLTFEGGFTYLDSEVTSLEIIQLYNDHLRTVRFGGLFEFSDKYSGANIWAAQVEKGLPFLGASIDKTSLRTSRFGGTANFFKINIQVSRLQSLFGRYSLFGQFRGQYSLDPLLAASQFGFGGSQLGRGYDPAEIIGDRGIAFSLELRADVAPKCWPFQSAQLYYFYDQGVIWNINPIEVTGVKQKQSCASTGVGSRFIFTKNVVGNVMFTQPLTKQVQALALIGNGRRPRVFFSITALL